VADGAIDFALDSLEDVPLRGSSVELATQHLRCTAIMLHDLDSHAAHRPVRRARIERVRRKLDIACRTRLGKELDTRLLGPAAGVASASETEVATLEAAAHALRRFVVTARQIGGAGQYDAQLRCAAEALRPIATEPAAACAHRTRLVEILLGPEAALAMLKPAASEGKTG
jgi:hypothetical protein